MSEDKSSKTEQPTQRKLEKAREKGQVAKSKDIPMLFVFVWSVAFLVLIWDPLLSWMSIFMAETGKTIYLYDFAEASKKLLPAAINLSLYKVVIPFVMSAAVVAIVSNIAQIGPLISFESITPKGSKIDPIAGFKRLFSAKSFITLILNLLKVISILAISYMMVKTAINYILVDINICNLSCLQFLNRYMYWTLAKYLIILFALIAILDFLKEKQAFIKDQMMSKQDIKQESKDASGDPQILQRRKQIARENAAEPSAQETIKETRLLIKDLGVCAALKYIEGETPLPILLSIGKGKGASQMEAIARAEKVKIVENPKLMAILLEEGTVNQYIPNSAIQEVVKALQK